MKKRNIKIFEAFAGIGSQYYALKKIPDIEVEVVGISEWDIKALKAYRVLHYPLEKNKSVSIEKAKKNLLKKDFSWNGNSKYDITKMSDEAIIDLYNTDKIVKNHGSVQNLSNSNKKYKKKKVNIFVYSFPCQDLATGGKGLGMKKGSGTRSGLLWELENYLKQLSENELSPDVLLLENVRAIYSDTHREDLNLWIKFLESIGYDNNIELDLNALDYGLPQNRRRAFIISINKRVTLKNKDIKDDIKKAEIPRNSLNVNNFVKIGYNKLEEDEAWLNITPSREKMWKINKKTLSQNPTLGTITCNLDRSNNAGMFRYKNSYRLLTMREAFSLMGFGPEAYVRINELGLSYRQLNKLIGNSIPVNLLEVIFKNILKNVKF
jgi:DNA (cytosine-5)-methyltransferase 1